MRLGLILILIWLAGCAAKPKKIEIDTAPVDVPEKVILHPPPPRALALIEIEPWAVITVNDGDPNFCVSTKGYEVLARNNAQILRWIRDAGDLIQYYRGLE
jgi:hypothetical protein